MIKPIKYIFLAVILVVPLLIAFLGLSSDFYILFCKICPARPIMPIFAGDIRRFGLEYSNWSTLIISIVSVSFAAITIVGSFFKDRFFCMVCPMLPLIHLFNKLSPVRFVKWLMDAAAVETVKEYAQWIYVKFTWKKERYGDDRRLHFVYSVYAGLS